MIVCPPGFYKSQQSGFVLLEPPDALKLLAIRYREQQKPLRSLRQLVAEFFAERDDLVPLHAGLPDDFVTAEGEFAAQTAVLVRRLADEKNGYVHIAAVFGDVSVSVIEAPVFTESAFESTSLLVRQLAYTAQLGLGYRKRRYLYKPPLGYFSIAQGLVTRFYPSLFPSQRAMLAVHPAVPRTLSPPDLCALLIERYRKKGLQFEHDGGAIPITSDFGLHGLTFCLSAPAPDGSSARYLQDLAIFADAHYLYTLVFESTSATDRSAVAKLLPAVSQSVRPLPAPAEPTKKSSAAAPASSIYL